MKKNIFSAIMIFSAAVSLFGAQEPKEAGASNPFRIYEGVYRPASGGTILITRTGVIEELARPIFLDWSSGRYGYLNAAGRDRFTSAASPAAKPDSPVQTEIVFGRGAGDRVESLVIREKGLPERRAERAEDFTDTETTFSNGAVPLAATLRMPKGGGPRPAIVLVHGSGPGTRTQLGTMSAYFAGLGMAVLFYDKRGCGASGGDWKKVDLKELAEDALAGVRWLKSRPGIDPSRVGLWGISQGGWITPLAASLDDAPAFAINSSGPATSLRRQDTFMMANTLKAEGFTEDETAFFIKGMNLMYDYGQGKASAEALDAILEQGRANPKFKDLVPPPTKDLNVEALYARQKIGDPAWFFHMNPDNDALTPYRKLHCPVLVTYGKLDYTVPVEESVGLLKTLIAETGSRTISIAVISDAGHGVLKMRPDKPMSPVEPLTISAELFKTIEGWLGERGMLPKR